MGGPEGPARHGRSPCCISIGSPAKPEEKEKKKPEEKEKKKIVGRAKPDCLREIFVVCEVLCCAVGGWVGGWVGTRVSS